ncbi:MAG: hypothetical protein WAV09_04900 [Minisyncoccia bacterium]
MESILKADIFFFVTTVAVVLLTALVATALLHLIKLLRTMRESSEIIKDTVTQVSQTVMGAHDNIGSFLQKLNVVQLIRSAFSGKRKATTNKKQEDHDKKE